MKTITPSSFMPETATLEHTNLRYMTAGQGEPLVFLHGVGGFKELWWATMDALQARFHMVAFDWPGHGSPPFPSDTNVLEELTERTIAACAELGLEHITLVGHSLGGNVAARVALRHPALVTRLVLVDAAVHNTHLPFYGKIYSDPRWSKPTARTHATFTRAFGRWGANVPHHHDGGLLQTWARRCTYMAQTDETVLQSYVRAVYEGSLGESLRDIQQPTLVLTGARDMLVRPAQARTIAALIPNAQLTILRGAYHNPMDEQPEAFRRALLEFLDDRPPHPEGTRDHRPIETGV